MPTVIEGEEGVGIGDERLLEVDDICEEAPVSMYHSTVWGPDGGTLVVARAASMA